MKKFLKKYWAKSALVVLLFMIYFMATRPSSRDKSQERYTMISIASNGDWEDSHEFITAHTEVVEFRPGKEARLYICKTVPLFDQVVIEERLTEKGIAISLTAMDGFVLGD